MRPIYALGLCAVLLGSCTPPQKPSLSASPTAVANRFVDAFYSFHPDSLQAVLSSAPSSQPEIVYYQKWAECAHYAVINRTCYFMKNDSVVVYPVTVKDDLMKALSIDFNVTDTFHITVQKDKIVSVTTSSNDVAEYYAAKEWVMKNRPALVAKACEGIWAGGPTPCECVQGMIQGFKEYTAGKQKLN